MPLPVHPARLAARPGHRHDSTGWPGVAFMPHAPPRQDRTRLSDAGFGGRCSLPEPECPPPGLLHGGSDPMAMNRQPGAWLRRLRGNIGQGRPNTGPGMASADAAWPHRSPPIGNHQPHILAALRPSGLQRRMCPWISFSPELGLAGQPTLGDPLFFAHSVGRLTVTVLPLTPGKSANSASIMAGICGATAADSLRVTSVDS